jgi:hypothetical protein
VPFSPPQPRHTVSVRALSSSSSGSSIRVSFIPDNSTGASFLGSLPVGMKSISMCCALRRAALGAILSLILFRTYRARGQSVRVSSIYAI